MARTPPSPANTVALAIDSLSRLVRNLLIDNVNFRSQDRDKSGYYFEQTPRTVDFVSRILKGQAESILERIEDVRTLAMDMAAYADIPGMRRSQEGTLHDRKVTVTEGDDGWRVSIAVEHAFHDGDDVEAMFKEESDALDAVRAFAETGVIPESFGPVGADREASSGPSMG